ncbi:hypothetical protein PR048_030184 [Dryococelus australis]|uniref:PiggyBac transposable element-derived protein domain-containing protein n=1 Tax=Dryococelus australis TaxID=614101 RepID=A0ABQ9G877_9NEOP|nr:hypothetical protein PR048_030184 [Dryococelus australis]
MGQICTEQEARAYGANAIHVLQLWSREWGPIFYTNTMSRNRFTEIMRFLRFDEKSTCSSRKQDDKFRFGKNDITIDEQLFPSKCRCPFTQYTPNQPDKFGVKYWLAVDSKNQYILNGFLYLGKDATRPAHIPLGEHVVLRLMEPFFDKGRNVTTDSYFSPVSLASELKKRKPALNDMVLTSYQGKVTKNVLVLSTLHTGVDIDQQTEKKIQ